MNQEESFHAIDFNLMLVIKSLKKLDRMEKKINDLVIHIFSSEPSKSELFEIHKNVNVITDEMFSIHSKIKEVLSNTANMFSDMYINFEPDAKEALKLVKSQNTYEEAVDNFSKKEIFIMEVRDINEQFETELIIKDLEEDYHNVLKKDSENARLSLLHSLNVKLPIPNEKMPIGFKQKILDLRESIKENINLLNLDNPQKIHPLDAKKLKEEMEEIKESINEAQQISCKTPKDFIEMRKFLQNLHNELSEIRGYFLSHENILSSEELHILLHSSSNLLNELEFLLEGNVDALQYCIHNTLEPIETSDETNCLFDSLKSQVEGKPAPQKLRRLTIQYLKENREKYEDDVLQNMSLNDEMQEAYHYYLNKIGRKLMHNSFGYKKEEIPNIEQSFLIETGKKEIDRILEEELKRTPDNFDRYCHWMELEEQSASELEIDAISQELQRPILIFSGEKLFLEKILNENFSGDPLFLYHSKDNLYQAMKVRRSKKNL